MKYFQRLDLPGYPDILDDLKILISNKIIDWGPHNQICINSTVHHKNDFKFGTGSLNLDWDNVLTSVDDVDIKSLKVKKRAEKISEDSFVELCDQFKNTSIENLYDTIKKSFKVGRIRLILLPPRSCMSWHRDTTKRIHYPVKTSYGSFMVINDEIMHLPQNTWWMTDTTNYHTAFNSSSESRIHIVISVIE